MRKIILIWSRLISSVCWYLTFFKKNLNRLQLQSENEIRSLLELGEPVKTHHEEDIRKHLARFGIRNETASKTPIKCLSGGLFFYFIIIHSQSLLVGSLLVTDRGPPSVVFSFTLLYFILFCFFFALFCFILLYFILFCEVPKFSFDLNACPSVCLSW